jgi:DNA-binding transcriptional LysR family regulator
VLCAAPAYLAEHGVPGKPSDLAGHDAIVFSTGTAEPEWRFERRGRRLSVEPRARLVVNTTEVAISAAVLGRGVTRLLSYQVDAEIRAGRLRIVLPEYEPPPLPVHVVHAGGKRPSAKVRSFVDLAVTRLRAAAFSAE